MLTGPVTRRRQTITESGQVHAPTRTLVKPIIKNQASYEALHDKGNVNGNITIDLSESNVWKMTLTGNVTAVALTNPPGPCVSRIWIHAGTGGFTVANWDADVDWGGDEPVVSAGAGKFDIVVLEYDGGSIYAAQIVQGADGDGFG